MTVWTLVLVLLLLGVIWWAASRFAAQIGSTLVMLIKIVIVVTAFFIVLTAFGVLGTLQSIRVPNVGGG